jgi:hypothetical protein
MKEACQRLADEDDDHDRKRAQRARPQDRHARESVQGRPV